MLLFYHHLASVVVVWWWRLLFLFPWSILKRLHFLILNLIGAIFTTRHSSSNWVRVSRKLRSAVCCFAELRKKNFHSALCSLSAIFKTTKKSFCWPFISLCNVICFRATFFSISHFLLLIALFNEGTNVDDVKLCFFNENRVRFGLKVFNFNHVTFNPTPCARSVINKAQVLQTWPQTSNSSEL